MLSTGVTGGAGGGSSSSSAERRQRRRQRQNTGAAVGDRAAMNRRNRALHIRKLKREELLSSRRRTSQRQPGVIIGTTTGRGQQQQQPDGSTTNAEEDPRIALRELLQLQQQQLPTPPPMDANDVLGRRRRNDLVVRLRRALLAMSSFDSDDDDDDERERFYNALLLADDDGGMAARRLVVQLIATVTSNNNSTATDRPDEEGDGDDAAAAVDAALSILLELSRVRPPPSLQSSDDYYYGSRPPEWNDVLLEEENGAATIPSLVMLVSKKDGASDGDSSRRRRTKELALTVLGHLVDNCDHGSLKAIKQLQPYWGAPPPTMANAAAANASTTVVDALPYSSYLVAAVLRYDSTTLGTEFLRNRQLTTQKLTQLLLVPSSSEAQQQQQEQQRRYDVDAAWMIESLSRREDTAVDSICADLALLEALFSRMARYAAVELNPAATTTTATIGGDDDDAMMAGTETPASSPSYFLLPAIRAAGNLASACDGRYVPLLLSNRELVESVKMLMDNYCTTINSAPRSSICSSYVSDCVWLAGCLLCDAGVPGHPSTLTACPELLRPLVRILTSRMTPAELVRDSARAVSNAVREPPYSAYRNDVYCPDVYSVSVQSCLNGIVNEYLLLSQSASSPDVARMMIRALLQMAQPRNNPDADAALASTRILDALLRRGVPRSSVREVFEDAGGVDVLEELASAAADDGDDIMYLTCDIAADLLDDFFQSDNEENEDDMVAAGGSIIEPSTTTVTGQQQQHFAFGLATQPQQPQLAFGQQPPPPGAARGRGRGRTVPAWMTSTS